MNNLKNLSEEQFAEMMYNTFPDQFKSEGDRFIRRGFEIGPGWHNRVYSLCKELDIIQKTHNITVKFIQIKEKFGSGRFYYDIIDNASEPRTNLHNIIDNMVAEAEISCGKIDIITGDPIDKPLNINGWIFPMSQQTYDKRKEGKC